MAQNEKHQARLVRLSDTEFTVANPAEDVRGRIHQEAAEGAGPAREGFELPRGLVTEVMPAPEGQRLLRRAAFDR
jgi:hypothetical protein